VLNNGISALDKQLNSLDFVILKDQLQLVGDQVSNTLTTMVQGVLLGTQKISDLWSNMLRNIALQLLNRGTSQLISSGITAVAAFATGQNVEHLAHGGSFMVNGRPGIDTNLVRFKATRGERVTVETPEQVRVREGGGQPIINIINNTGQSAEAAESRTPDGSFRAQITIGKLMANDINERGPLSQAIEARLNLKRGGR